MVGVTGHADAGELGKDRGAAFSGVFQFFQKNRAGAFADNEPVPVPIEGTGRPLRLIISSRQRLHRGEATQAKRRYAPFRASGQHRVGHACLNEQIGITDGVSGCEITGQQEIGRRSRRQQ